jgi:hypothetical protein
MHLPQSARRRRNARKRFKKKNKLRDLNAPQQSGFILQGVSQQQTDLLKLFK